jgi:hypothetical protein
VVLTGVTGPLFTGVWVAWVAWVAWVVWVVWVVSVACVLVSSGMIVGRQRSLWVVGALGGH